MSTPPANLPHRYFVSYTGQNHAGPVSGWSDLNLHAPIRSGKDIQQISEYLKDANKLLHVTIVNFQRFDAETGGAA